MYNIIGRMPCYTDFYRGGFCALLYAVSAGVFRVEGDAAMTEKELKKLNRYQLLELLIVQTERADKLQAQLERAQERLNEKEIQMTVLGSIAEASLELSGVFTAAQKAADLYLEAARKQADRIVAEAEENAKGILGIPQEDPERTEKIMGMLEAL